MPYLFHATSSTLKLKHKNDLNILLCISWLNCIFTLYIEYTLDFHDLLIAYQEEELQMSLTGHYVL